MSDFDLTTITPRTVEAWEIQEPTTPVQRVPSKTKRLMVAGIAVAAGVAAAFGTLEPTGVETVDLVWRVGIAVLATAAASTARRWSLIWLGAASAASASSLFGLVAGVSSLGLAVVSARMSRHNRIIGAFAGALGAQSLVRPATGSFSLLYAALLISSVGAVSVSAYRLLRRRHRHKVRLVVGFAAVGLVLVGAASVASAVLARSDMEDAVDRMQAGLDEIEDGNDAEAQVLFDRADAQFSTAYDRFTAPWLLPARAFPVLSQHVRAGGALADSGAELAVAASEVAAGADYRDLRLTRGQLNLVQIEGITPAVEEAAEVMGVADARMEEYRDEWLIPPLADAVDRLQSEIDDVRPETELAADALAVLPSLLGGDGDRRYLVAITSPNETRNSGGFMGGYAELTAKEGKVEKVDAGSISELNAASDAGTRTLEMNEEYDQRYGTYQPARFLQNLTVSPDLPTNARVIARLYPQAGGAPINGVILIDPLGLSALLELTGPILVEGIDRPLDAQSVVPFLLSEQYVEFPENDDRDEIQANVAEATFDALLSASLPGPRAIGAALGPAVEAGHIGMYTFDLDEQPFLEEVGLADRFEPGDDDFLSVRVANNGPNKLDAYLSRSIDYDIALDPENGTYTGEVTVTLRNDAPEGLNDYVAATRELREGRPNALPLGTNRLFVTAYSNSTVRGATIGENPVAIGVQPELGTRAHTARVEVPRGGEVTIRYQVEGTYDDGLYRLRLSHQPLAKPDEVSVDVTVPDGYSVELVKGDPDDVSSQVSDLVYEVRG